MDGEIMGRTKIYWVRPCSSNGRMPSNKYLPTLIYPWQIVCQTAQVPAKLKQCKRWSQVRTLQHDREVEGHQLWGIFPETEIKRNFDKAFEENFADGTVFKKTLLQKFEWIKNNPNATPAQKKQAWKIQEYLINKPAWFIKGLVKKSLFATLLAWGWVLGFDYMNDGDIDLTDQNRNSANFQHKGSLAGTHTSLSLTNLHAHPDNRVLSTRISDMTR